MFLCTFIAFGIVGYYISFKVACDKGWFWFYSSILETTIQLVLYLLVALVNPGIIVASMCRQEKASSRKYDEYGVAFPFLSSPATRRTIRCNRIENELYQREKPILPSLPLN